MSLSQNIQSIQTAVQTKNVSECISQLRTLIETANKAQQQPEKGLPTTCVSTVSFQRSLLIIREAMTLSDSPPAELLIACHSAMESLQNTWKQTSKDIRANDTSVSPPVANVINCLLNSCISKSQTISLMPMISTIPDELTTAKTVLTKDLQHLQLMEMTLCNVYFYLFYSLKYNAVYKDGEGLEATMEVEKVITAVGDYLNYINQQYPTTESKLVGSTYKCLYNLANTLIVNAKNPDVLKASGSGSIFWSWSRYILIFHLRTNSFKPSSIASYFSAVLRKIGLIGTLVLQQHLFGDMESNSVPRFLQTLRNVVEGVLTTDGHNESVIDALYSVALFFVAKLLHEDISISKECLLTIVCFWKLFSRSCPTSAQMFPIQSSLESVPANITASIEKMNKLWNIFIIHWSYVYEKSKKSVDLVWTSLQEHFKPSTDFSLCIWLQYLIWNEYSPRLMTWIKNGSRLQSSTTECSIVPLNDLFTRLWTLSIHSSMLPAMKEIIQCYLDLQLIFASPPSNDNNTIEQLFEKVSKLSEGTNTSSSGSSNVGVLLFKLHRYGLMLRMMGFVKKKDIASLMSTNRLLTTIELIRKLITIEFHSSIGPTVLSTLAMHIPTVSEFCYLSGYITKQTELWNIVNSRLTQIIQNSNDTKSSKDSDPIVINTITHMQVSLEAYMMIMDTWYNFDTVTTVSTDPIYSTMKESMQQSSIGEILHNTLCQPIRDIMSYSDDQQQSPSYDWNESNPDELCQSLIQQCHKIFGRSMMEIYCIKGWIHLLMAKLVWITSFDFEQSLKLTKLAMSYSTCAITTDTSSTSSSGSNGSNPLMSIVPIEYQTIRLESLLFASDLYDHKGKLSKCLDYIAEGKNQLHGITMTISTSIIEQYALPTASTSSNGTSTDNGSSENNHQIFCPQTLFRLLTNKYLIYTLRIWCRSHSRHLSELINHAMISMMTMYVSSNDKDVSIDDEITPVFIGIVLELAQSFHLLQTSISELRSTLVDHAKSVHMKWLRTNTTTNGSNKKDKKSRSEPISPPSSGSKVAMMLCHMWREWGFTPNQFQNLLTSSSMLIRSTPTSTVSDSNYYGCVLFHSIYSEYFEKLHDLDQLLTNDNDQSNSDRNTRLEDINEHLRIIWEEGSSIYDAASFDCQRWIRRRLCRALIILTTPQSGRENDDDFDIIHRRDSTTSDSPTLSVHRSQVKNQSLLVSNDLLAFIFGASSCFHLLEQQEKEITEKTIIGERLHQALNGCQESQGNIATSIQQLLKCLDTRYSVSPSCNTSQSNVCFLAIEPAVEGQTLRHLLVGSMNAQQRTRTVSIVLTEEMEVILSKWEQLQKANQDSLRLQSNNGSSSGITEKQKRDWWKGRELINDQLEDYYKELQEMLLPALTKVLEWIASPSDDGSGDISPMGEDGDGDDIDRLVATFDQIAKPSSSSSRSTGPATAKKTTSKTPVASKRDDIKSLTDSMGALSMMLEDDDVVVIPPQQPAAVDYDSMKLVELRELLETRQLSKIGKKAELVERLLEHDRQKHQQQPPLQARPPSLQPPQTQSKPAKKAVVIEIYDSDEDVWDINKNVPKPTMTAFKSTAKKPKPIDLTNDTEAMDASSSTGMNTNNSNHTIFILDESLQSIPLESMPIFRDKSCSRYPSIALLLQAIANYDDITQTTHVSEQSSKKKSITSKSSTVSFPVNTIRNGWFAIDIENNLKNTRQTMETFLNPYQEKLQWASCVGKMPTNDFVK